MSEELKPCPFCGGTSTLLVGETPQANGPPNCDFIFVPLVFMQCDKCGLTLKQIMGMGARDKAIAAWNTRPASAKLKAVEEERDKWRALEDNSWDLRCHSVPSGADDFDIRWVVVEHYQAAPREREIGSGATPLEAIEQSLNPDQN